MPEGGRTGGLHPAAETCGVPHTVQFLRKNAKSVVSKESRTRASCAKVCDLSTGRTKKAKLNTGFIKKSLNGYVYERDSRAQGTVSTQSTPIRGPKSPRPAGALARFKFNSWVGAPSPRPGPPVRFKSS